MTKPTLALSFDLHPVGPRSALVGGADVSFALNIAAAYLDDGTAPTQPDDVAAGVAALMPGALFPDTGAQRTFRLFRLTTTKPNPFPPIVINAPIPAATAFSQALAAQIQTDAEAMATAGQLTVGWNLAHVHDGDTEAAEGQPKPWPWFGMASALARLAPSLSHPLRSRWFVQTAVQPLLNDLAAEPSLHLVLAPVTLHDQNRNATYTLAELLEGAAPADRVRLRYEAGGEPDIFAEALPLPGRALDPGAGAPLDSYWLAVADSRDGGLAEFDRAILDAAAPISLAALPSVDILAAAMRYAVAPDPPRTPTGAQAAIWASAAAQYAASLTTTARAAQARLVLDATLAGIRGAFSAKDLVKPLAAALAGWWEDHWTDLHEQVVGGAFPDRDKEVADITLVAADLAAALEAAARQLLGLETAAVRKASPGEGIDFVIGAPDQRLAAFTLEEGQVRTDENEMAVFGLMVRRSSSGTFDAAGADWRLVTAGVPVLDPPPDMTTNPPTPGHLLRQYPWGAAETLGLTADTTLAIGGIALAYDKGVLRNDDTYRGQLMIGPSALAFTHAERGEGAENPTNWHDPVDVVYASAAIHATPNPGYQRTLAPPLRYDDYYELAAFVVDRGGGLPRQLAAANRPWELDVTNLGADRSKVVRFQRRVPIGELDVKAGAGPGPADWPKPPDGVALLASDWWGASSKAPQPPTLLFTAQNVAVDPAKAGLLLPQFSFRIGPPRIDEHTLQRWALPPTTAARNTSLAAITDLKAELARIADERNRLLADPALKDDANDLLPHDPAVWGVRVRARTFRADGTLISTTTEHLQFQPRAPSPFLKTPITIEIGPGAATPTYIPRPAAGQFISLEVDLLCADADQARFDADALDYGGLEHISTTQGAFYVHPGTSVLLEAVNDTMPTANDLYAAFTVDPDASGRIEARVRGAVANLCYVERFEIARERWVWRNLPYVVDDTVGDTLERRLASGLPLALASPTAAIRDTTDAVLKFDAAAVLDHGFVARPVVAARWPRAPDGFPAPDVLLLADDRDGISAADYLRYGLTVFSRYATILKPERGSVQARPAPNATDFGEMQGPWRRITTRFRGGGALRPLNILAVLPLTAKPTRTADLGLPELAEGATPFLVVVDEVWFREYGQGEMLRAQLAIEDAEIGDKAEDSGVGRPLRYGPMPHKHLQPSGDTNTFTESAADAADIRRALRLRLSVFGPFGFSLDRSGNEALANASAFVVYMPTTPVVGPNWSVAVRFRRVLQGLSSDGSALDEQRSQTTSPYLLYTLADSRALVRSERLDVKVDATSTPTGDIAFVGDQPVLHPYIRGGQPPPASIQAEYRYVLLVGRLARDGGRGVDAFLPLHAYWLPDTTHATAIETGPLSADARLQGQVLEIETSGGFTGAGPLEAATNNSLRGLFKALLQHPDDGSPRGADALGRIIRVSEPFDVRLVGL